MVASPVSGSRAFKYWRKASRSLSGAGAWKRRVLRCATSSAGFARSSAGMTLATSVGSRAEAHRDGLDDLRRWIVLGEEAPKFPGEELRAGRLFHQDADDVVAQQRTGFSHERFRADVSLSRSEPKLLRGHVDAITGEGAGRFANVGFGIVADPDGEKFHQFARPVFVRVLFAALLEIEVDHHRGIARDFLGEGGKISDGMTAEQIVLAPHPITVSHFLDAGREVAVPEERHLFDQRRGRGH